MCANIQHQFTIHGNLLRISKHKILFVRELSHVDDSPPPPPIGKKYRSLKYTPLLPTLKLSHKADILKPHSPQIDHMKNLCNWWVHPLSNHVCTYLHKK